ncbi:MAG TPA: redoxin family protein [Chloroflexia bacterium]|nr:redoxin family protein [Chloroflexia bacterium]
MSMRHDNIEPDELDLLLNAAERGVAGQLLRAASDEIEPSAEFAQGLENRLMANASSRVQPERPVTQRQSSLTEIMGRSKRPSGNNRTIGTFGRFGPAAMGVFGAAAMLLLFIGMAAMLSLRQGQSDEPADSRSLAKDFTLLHTLSLYLSASPSQDVQMAWSPKGKMVAAAFGSGVSVWDGETGQFLYMIPFGNVGNIEFSPDGSLLAVALNWNVREGGGIQLVDTLTGRKVRYLIPAGAVSLQVGTKSISWSPDGRLLASASGEPFPDSSASRDGVIHIWEVGTGTELSNIRVPADESGDAGLVSKVTWSPTGNTLASLSGRGVLRLWNALTGQMLHYLSPMKFYDVGHVEWSPDGNMVAVVAERQVEVWDVESGTLLMVLPESVPDLPTPMPTIEGPVPPVLTSVASTAIALTGMAPTILPQARNELHATSSDFFNITSLLWSPDSSTLLTADGGHIRLWDPSTGEVKLAIDDRAYWLAWSPDGSALAASGDLGGVRIFDGNGTPVSTLPYDGARHLAWSANGRMLALSREVFKTDLKIAIWGVRSEAEPVATATATGVATQVVPTIAPTLASNETSVVQTPGTLPVGTTMPDFSSMDLRTNQSVKLSSLRGKPLMLTFWGTWCPPCRGQMPTLQKAYETYGKDIEFLNVSMGPRDTPEAALAFITQNGYKGTFTHVDGDSSIYNFVSAVPAMYFLDRDGIVRAVHVGEMSESQLEEYIHQLGVTPPQLPTSGPQSEECGAWSIVDSPNVNSVNELSSVVAISADDIWAVGYHSIGSSAYADVTPVPAIDYTLIMQWDGKNWRNVPSPNVGGEKMHNRLLGVSGVASDDVWAVGYYANSESLDYYNASESLILHWDGNEWKAVQDFETGAGPSQLHAVVAISRNDAWAVGHRGVVIDPSKPDPASPAETLILHWNGQKWSQVSSPSPAPFFNKLYGVSASSADDMWAVGIQSYSEVRGGGGGLPPYPLALHWDGKSWSVTPISTPDNLDDTSKFPMAVAALTKNEVYAVGGIFGEGGSDSIAMHWDGTKWTHVGVDVPKPPEGSGPAQDHLSGVAALSKDDVWAVGAYLRYGAKPLNDTSPLAMHWNGKEWSYISIPDPRYTLGPNGSAIENIGSNALSAIAAAPNGDLWAVGSSSITSPTGARQSNSLIMRYITGPCGTPSPTP